MNIIVIIAGIYLLCCALPLVMIVILTKQTMLIADFFRKKPAPIKSVGMRKAKMTLAFLIFCPVINLIVGILTFFIQPDDLYFALDERNTFVPR